MFTVKSGTICIHATIATITSAFELLSPTPHYTPALIVGRCHPVDSRPIFSHATTIVIYGNREIDDEISSELLRASVVAAAAECVALHNNNSPVELGNNDNIAIDRPRRVDHKQLALPAAAAACDRSRAALQDVARQARSPHCSSSSSLHLYSACGTLTLTLWCVCQCSLAPFVSRSCAVIRECAVLPSHPPPDHPAVLDDDGHAACILQRER
uniref:Uncharacterized protein n=1 Tax=Trichogramma kaykai TaxID=54128 RepID=A0ABD2WCG6_9HYME